MTKITITDTPEIEALNARIAELTATTNALRKERDQLRVENTNAILDGAGVVLGVTKVRVWEPRYLGGETDLREGPFIPLLVRPQGPIEFAKAKKDGTPSAASSGLSGVTEFEVIE